MDKGKFGTLVAYIPKIEATNYFGKWVHDKRGEGTPLSPKQFSYFKYSRLVNSLVDDFYDFAKLHPEFALNDYKYILEWHEINWNYDDMRLADVDDMDAGGILALIMAAIRADRFMEGALQKFFKDGSILRWLKRLKELEN